MLSFLSWLYNFPSLSPLRSRTIQMAHKRPLPPLRVLDVGESIQRTKSGIYTDGFDVCGVFLEPYTVTLNLQVI